MASTKQIHAVMGATDFEERIGELLNESARAGDHAQVLLCEQALGAGEGGSSATPVERRDARWTCAEVLADSEAQS